jgi:hypothetical protein
MLAQMMGSLVFNSLTLRNNYYVNKQKSKFSRASVFLGIREDASLLLFLPGLEFWTGRNNPCGQPAHDHRVLGLMGHLILVPSMCGAAA